MSASYRHLTAAVFAIACVAGCGHPAPPPDGSSGIRGRCLLPADGNEGERERWAGLRISAQRVNTETNEREVRSTADGRGEFRIPLNPGDYSVGVYDPKLLKNKAVNTLLVKVEAGRFAEVAIDYDELRIRDLTKK